MMTRSALALFVMVWPYRRKAVKVIQVEQLFSYSLLTDLFRTAPWNTGSSIIFFSDELPIKLNWSLEYMSSQQ